MNPQLLACLAADYGLGGTLESLYSYQDQAYVLRASDRPGYTVKVMHTGCDPGEVALQCAVLHHLADDDELPVPHLRRTLDGRQYTQCVDAGGTEHLVWVVEFIPGTVAADYRPLDAAAVFGLGAAIAALHVALSGYQNPRLERDFKWQLTNADWLNAHVHALEQAHPAHAAWFRNAVQEYCKHTQADLLQLPHQAIHGDLNDHNVVYDMAGVVTGIIDFGDAHRAPPVCDLAIAAAYFMMGQREPVQALDALVRGYHSVRALAPEECAVLVPLLKMRLVQSLTHSLIRRGEAGGDAYLTISEQPALALIEQLADVPERFIVESVYVAVNASPLAGKWQRCCTALTGKQLAPVIAAHWHTAPILDLSADGAAPGDPFSGIMSDPLADGDAVDFVIGRYGEPRLVYQSPLFKSGDHPTDDARTIHAGVDLFAHAGTPVHAPLAGHVHALGNHTQSQDYGPVIVLRHVLDSEELFTLYGHLDGACLDNLQVGDSVSRGQVFCHVGAPPGNGDWPPHLHFQCVLEDCSWGTDIPGVSYDWSWPVWRQFFPNPAPLLDLADAHLAYPVADNEVLLRRRRKLLGANLSVAYSTPLKIIRGWQQYLFDERSRCYLDAYNNVPHVGHCHPRVVAAVTRQMARLSTNTRYLHDTIVEYADALGAMFADPLGVCFFVNSASEANELALRLARAATAAKDLIVMAGAYHGHTTTLIDISPYKAEGPGGSGCPDWVHQVPLVDLYRGEFRYGDPHAAGGYAQHVTDVINAIAGRGRRLCGYICESLPSVGGQLVYPEGYLQQVYAAVRAAGGLCIADEVQTGFGRVGDHFWGFEQQSVQPDIVVLGKPIGNGHPLAAVVTTPAIAAAFANGMEFFSTFGGNTVSCAAGLEVLRIVQEEQVQQHIKATGDYLKHMLKDVSRDHPMVGDVRGMGLFLGIEMVMDRDSQEPAPGVARHIANRLRNLGILVGTDGIFDNVLKIRPPAPFNNQDAIRLAETLGTILNDSALSH